MKWEFRNRNGAGRINNGTHAWTSFLPKESSLVQTLLVLGAGPKAIAIATKRSVLAKSGYPMPQLVIVDNQGIVAHWSGKFGFTDGRQLLGTRPEKDVGFPYASTCWGNDDVNNAVANEMLRCSHHHYPSRSRRKDRKSTRLNSSH